MSSKKKEKFKFEKKNFDFKKIKDSFWRILLNKFGTIFTSIFLIAAVLGGFIVYKYIYGSEWSDVQKREYRIKVENSKPPFDLDKFDDVVSKVNERSSISDESVYISKDIFGTSD